ncbi:MAG TPA: MOSC N-terminal beta barrel domain-containing protein [Candidatus Binataceae bacterium]|nr:MOSC N-terminal beta barrel domain-containing protein [Candidatus Binataceae bacterium]
MERRKVAVVSAVFRYPVKSMLGEKPAELELTTNGTLGDRAWAVREASGRIATAKKWPAMLGLRASYDSPPRSAELAPITIVFPDGGSIHAADPDASARLSAVLGRPVLLERAKADEHSRGEIDPQTIFADVPVEQIFPGLTSQTIPDTFGLMRGAFFDSAPIHVLASGSLEHLKRLCGGDSILDARRFRPNIFVDTSGTGADGFVEDEWLDGTLEIGETAKIVGMKPALRCVMTTHAQTDLPRDLSILRTAARHHKATLGVFASIGAPGTVRVGDPVYLSR